MCLGRVMYSLSAVVMVLIRTDKPIFQPTGILPMSKKYRSISIHVSRVLEHIEMFFAFPSGGDARTYTTNIPTQFFKTESNSPKVAKGVSYASVTKCFRAPMH